MANPRISPSVPRIPECPRIGLQRNLLIPSVLGELNWSQIPIVRLVFGRSDWSNEHDYVGRGGSVGLDEPAAAGRDQVSARRGQGAEGASGEETPAVHRRSEESPGAQGKADRLRPIEGHRGLGDSADLAGVASQADRATSRSA